MPLTFIVFGATGMAGHMITCYLLERGHRVVTYSRRALPTAIEHSCRLLALDERIGTLADADRIVSLVKEVQADAVVNAVGMLNQACDNYPAEAIYANSYFPHWLAAQVNHTGGKLIHLSTDCVFSGDGGPYNEQRAPDGASRYDRSKALGETWSDRHLCLRQSIVGPDFNASGIGLFHWFMQQQGQLKGYRRAVWSGVTTLTLAQAIEQAAVSPAAGLMHLVNDVPINKYELLQLFNKHCRKVEETVTIIPDDEICVNKALVNTRTDLPIVVPSYEQMIIDMQQWVKGHAELYPHYKR